MLALRSAPPAVGLAEAVRIAGEVYGRSLALTPLAGERDCNFHGVAGDGRQYVLRIVDGAADAASVDCQVRVLEHLAEQDPSLPVPRLVPTRGGSSAGSAQHEGLQHATLLTDYLPGRLLADALPGPDLLSDVGGMLARVDRALRGFFHPALGRRIAWDVRRLPELMEFAPLIESLEARRRVAAVAADFVPRLPALRALRSQALHGDAHGANILVSAAGTVCGLIDFGDMIHAPLALEPAVTMSELLTEGLAAALDLAGVLEGYTRVEALQSAEVDALYDLIAARHAVIVLLHAWRVRDDVAGARVLERAAANALPSLDRLAALGRAALTQTWHRAAGTAPRVTPNVPGVASVGAARVGESAPAAGGVEARGVDLRRRRRLLGAGAELFYDEPVHLVRGLDVWLHDAAGRAYLDVYNNVPHVGHCHPAVVEAIQRQSRTLNTHTRYLHDGILDYAERLTARCPRHLDTCIFVNSGSEANDVAWRMAQFATGRTGALVMAHAYHGITDAVAALTPGAGQPSDARVVTLLPPPAHLGWEDVLSPAEIDDAAADVDAAVDTLRARGIAPAAFFIDSALTSSGVFDPPEAWMASVSARLRAAGALLVADEVQYGLGRSGSHFWGFERRGLAQPDIITLGKPVANGYPMGVVVANRELVEAFQARFGFFSTFGGNPVAAAAGSAVLEVLDRERLMANASSTGEYLRARLGEVATRHPSLGQIRGAGLLLGVEVRGADPRAAKARTHFIVNRLASDSRVLIGSEGPLGNMLKLRPPLTFRVAHADRLVDAIDAAAAAIG